MDCFGTATIFPLNRDEGEGCLIRRLCFEYVMDKRIFCFGCRALFNKK